MADSLGKDSLEVRAERRVRVATRESGFGDVGDGRAWVAEDGRPLLDFLEEVLREESGVTRGRTMQNESKWCSEIRRGQRTRFRARPASSGMCQ